LGPAIPVLPAVDICPAPWTPRPRSSRAVASSRRAFDAAAPAPAPSLRSRHHPAYMPPIPSIIHAPRGVRCSGQEGGRAGGREENESLRVLVFGSSGYDVYAPWLRLRASGSGRRRCRCDCGCGRGWRCDTGLHGTGAGGGSRSVGSMRACGPGTDTPSGARCEDGGWGLRRG
jgi:hypothetical protein